MITDLIMVIAEIVDEEKLSPGAREAWRRVMSWRPAVIEVDDEEYERIQQIKRERDERQRRS